jgi:glycosyltransferase involved in cell wall biosynthesis
MRLGIASTFPPYRGGIASFNAAMAEALRQAGHEVECVTWSRQYPDRLFPGTSQWEPGKGPGDVSIPALLDSMSPRSWSKTGEHLAAHADVVVLPFWHAALAPALTGVAQSAKKHGVSHVWALMHNASSHDGNRLDRTLTRRLLNRVDGVLTLSAPVSESLREHRPHTLFHPLYDHHVSRPRKEEARRQLGLGKGEVVHLFFGLIRPYKGLRVLLDALAKLPEKHTLVVAGECYGSWAPYQNQINALGLQDRVKIHNEFIDDDDVPLFFSAADFVVLPYVSASQSGVTALALHHSVKVIASDVGDLATTVVPELTGRLVPPSDAAALAEAMDDPWTSQPADVQGAFEQVKKRLSWSAWAARLTQLVESSATEAR